MSEALSSHFFMPSFPIKSSKSRSPRKQKPVLDPGLKIDKKTYEKLAIFNHQAESKGRLLGYKNQKQFCENRSFILTPVRLTKLEISLPEVPTLSSPKFPPRRIGTAQTRRKSIESKSFLNAYVEYPAEITTRKYSARLNSANVRQFEKRKNSEKMRNTQKFQLIRNRTGDERNKNRANEKVGEGESASPTNYSPLFTNTYD